MPDVHVSECPFPMHRPTKQGKMRHTRESGATAAAAVSRGAASTSGIHGPDLGVLAPSPAVGQRVGQVDRAETQQERG